MSVVEKVEYIRGNLYILYYLRPNIRTIVDFRVQRFTIRLIWKKYD